MKFRSFALMVMLAAPVTASAQVAEIRIGMGQWGEDVLNMGTEIDNRIETSAAVQTEVIFGEPRILEWAFSPQPYVNATLNLAGQTSSAGAGLMWRQTLGRFLYADAAAGVAVHNGSLDFTADDYRRSDGSVDTETYAYDLDTKREYGSRALIRVQGTLGMRVSEDWATEVFFEHMSNGSGSIYDRDARTYEELIRRRENDSVDTLGMRAARRF